MKTLDEVITAHELCIERIRKGEDNCPADCSFISCCDPERRVLELDALHYLKEYRTLQTAYTTAMADAEDNPPLTWNELKEMEGKPVWVKYRCFDAWMLITDVIMDSLWLVNTEGEELGLPKEDMGKTWQAYRKERKATGGNLTPEPKSKKIGDDTEIKWSENEKLVS